MGQYCGQIDIGFSVGIDVLAGTPEEALAKVREIIKQAKSGDGLLDLAQSGELQDWDVQLRGVFSDKSMLNNG